eukprot:11353893-Alexandrium_andersonii.AAC.1
MSGRWVAALDSEGRIKYSQPASRAQFPMSTSKIIVPDVGASMVKARGSMRQDMPEGMLRVH